MPASSLESGGLCRKVHLEVDKEMLSASVENRLVFSLFLLLASGLLFVVVCISLRRNHRPHHAPPVFRSFAAFFFLLSGHFLLQTFDSYLEILDPTAPVHSPLLHLAVNALETVAYLCLIPAYHRRLAGAPFVFVGAATWTGDATAGLFNLVVLVLVVVLHLIRDKPHGRFAIVPVTVILASVACRVLQAGWVSQGPLRSFLWSAENIFMLLSLVLFARVVEQRTRSLYTQIFVRLNLIFILVASLLMLTVTEFERKQLLEFDKANLDDLSEFLRGHVLHFYHQGRGSEEILANEEIIHKVVSEFGRIPDLRAVRVFFGGQWMELSIAPDGTVEHVIHQQEAGAKSVRTVRFSGDERIATVLTIPIYYNRERLGTVELDNSLQRIDAAFSVNVGRIFFAFSLLVLLSGVLIALTVRDTNRTIRRQYDKIDQASQQLLQAAKLASVGELADGVAHEINNPVGIILARTDYMQAVAEQQGLTPELLEDMRVVRSQAKRIAEIVQGLLTFSRPSALRDQSVKLNQVLERTLLLLGPRLRTSGIAVSSALDPNLPSIIADPDRLTQVFVNILNNAVDAMPQGGRVALATGMATPRTVFVRISDTGRGIAHEHLARIFDPFFSTKEPGKGTGLGLAISYGIVQGHGGEIQVESTAGDGSVFTILLPIRGA